MKYQRAKVMLGMYSLLLFNFIALLIFTNHIIAITIIPSYIFIDINDSNILGVACGTVAALWVRPI